MTWLKAEAPGYWDQRFTAIVPLLDYLGRVDTNHWGGMPPRRCSCAARSRTTTSSSVVSHVKSKSFVTPVGIAGVQDAG